MVKLHPRTAEESLMLCNINLSSSLLRKYFVLLGDIVYAPTFVSIIVESMQPGVVGYLNASAKVTDGYKEDVVPFFFLNPHLLIAETQNDDSSVQTQSLC